MYGSWGIFLSAPSSRCVKEEKIWGFLKTVPSGPLFVSRDYPVPDTSMTVSPSAAIYDKRRWTCNLRSMAVLVGRASKPRWASAVSSPARGYEVVMRNCIENFCPVWQRTVRSETTQDKARSLSPCQLSILSQSVKRNMRPWPGLKRFGNR